VVFIVYRALLSEDSQNNCTVTRKPQTSVGASWYYLRMVVIICGVVCRILTGAPLPQW